VYRGIGVAAIIAAAIVLAFAGCGGGSSDSSAASGETAGDTASSDTTPSGSASSKDAFIKEANRICEDGAGRIRNEQGSFVKEHGISEKKPATKEQEEEFITDIVAPSVRSQAEEVAELSAPEGDEEEVAAIVEGLEEVADAAEENPSSVFKEEPGGLLDEVNEVAEDYGAKECAQP
jgi:hypothetical protein